MYAFSHRACCLFMLSTKECSPKISRFSILNNLLCSDPPPLVGLVTTLCIPIYNIVAHTVVCTLYSELYRRVRVHTYKPHTHLSFLALFCIFRSKERLDRITSLSHSYIIHRWMHITKALTILIGRCIEDEWWLENPIFSICWCEQIGKGEHNGRTWYLDSSYNYNYLHLFL